MIEKDLSYIYHLDGIRIKKKIKISSLCEGICSDRQYRKYLTGTNNISDKRILEFCNKLKISAKDFYSTLHTKESTLNTELSDFYTNIADGEYLKAKKFIDAKNKITSVQSKRLYNYCKVRFDYETGILPLEYTLNLLKKEINYQELENITAFDFIDILSLEYIANLEIKLDIDKSLNLITKILNSDTTIFLTTKNMYFLAPLYSNTAIMLGKIGRFNECIEICDRGIEFCLEREVSRSLTRLYYCKAIALKKIGQLEDAEYFGLLCLSNSISLQNKNETNTFYKILCKDFNEDFFNKIDIHKAKFLN